MNVEINTSKSFDTWNFQKRLHKIEIKESTILENKNLKLMGESTTSTKSIRTNNIKYSNWRFFIKKKLTEPNPAKTLR